MQSPDISRRQCQIYDQGSPENYKLGKTPWTPVSSSEYDLNSTLASENMLKTPTSPNYIENEDILQQSLTYYNKNNEIPDPNHFSMHAQLLHKTLEHQTVLSTMRTIPVEAEDLKEKLSYYQDKLHKMFSVKLNDLVRLELLGKGAFGEVTRVFNKNDREFYALKEVKRLNFKKNIYYESAVWTEIQNLLKVTQAQNPLLLKTILIDFDEEQDICYLLMEYGKGTLEEYAECKKKYHSSWTEKELEYVLSQLIGQVLALKSLGIIHRDIKPSNVIISGGDDCLKLSDLGCASVLEEGVQKLNIVGTPHFMSPELIQAVMKRQLIVEHDPFLSDLYSIGATIIALLDPSKKRRDFKNYLETEIQTSYPNLYPIIHDLLAEPEQRKKALEKMLMVRPVISSYKKLEAASVGDNYKLYLYCKIVGKNKNLETSFYFDMFILDDALLVIQKQICALNENTKPGEQNLEEVVWRIRLARCYYLQTKYEESLKELEKLIQRKELKSFETNNLLTKARVLLWLGIVKAKSGKLQDAINHLMHCLGIRVCELGEIHEDVSAVFWHIGDTYLTQENFVAAEKAFKKSIEIGEKLGEKERRYMAKSYHSMGLMVEVDERFELSLEYFEKAKNINIKIYGEHHPNVADQHLAIANSYILLGQKKDGLLLSHKALEMKVKWYGKSNPEVAIAYMKIAKIYEKLGHYKTVHELLQKSVKIWQIVSGQESQEIAKAYRLVGTAMCREGHYHRAISFAEKVIGIKEKLLGENHPRIAAEYLWYAEVCHMLGKKEKKEECLTKFTTIKLSKLGQNTNSIKMLLQASRLYCEEGKIKEGFDYAQKALEICQNLAIPKDFRVYSEYYAAMGALKKAEGQYEKAREDIQKALEIRSKINCKEYDILTNLHMMMGNLCEDMNQHQEALIWYRKSEKLSKNSLCKESLLMAKVLLNVGKSLQKNGKEEEAIKKLERGRKILKELKIEEDAPLKFDYRGVIYENTYGKDPVDYRISIC